MKNIKVNKVIVEKVKTAVIFGAICVAIGFVLGDSYATHTQKNNQQEILNAVHTVTVKG